MKLFQRQLKGNVSTQQRSNNRTYRTNKRRSLDSTQMEVCTNWWRSLAAKTQRKMCGFRKWPKYLLLYVHFGVSRGKTVPKVRILEWWKDSEQIFKCISQRSSDISLATIEKWLSNEVNHHLLSFKRKLETPLPIVSLNLYPIHRGNRQCQCI